jgi:hypothetical protein
MSGFYSAAGISAEVFRGGLNAQVQLELAVNPVDAVVIPFEAVHIAQMQEA